MMDIDRISYIFGSFARRRQSQEVGVAKRRSIEPTKKVFHDRSKSTPHQSKKTVTTSPRAKSIVGFPVDEGKFKCPMCRRQYEDPRVLPCLHTFCLRCLQELEKRGFSTWYDDDPEVLKTNSTDSRKASSGGSGYASDKRDDSPCRSVCCPTCGSRTEVPPGGVSSFPPNYTLQHKIVLATLNSQSTHLLCDLCPSDVSAISRCMECAVSFCVHCEEVHLRQKTSSEHEVLTLQRARERGITKVRRQIMCLKHPDLELSVFCSTCFQVVCRDCVSVSHRGHTCEPISRAAKLHFSKLRLAADRAKSVVEESAVAAHRLSTTSKKIEAQCNKVQTEVEKFIEEYIKSVEEHKVSLLEQIRQVREEKLQSISREKLRLQKRIKDARDIAYFLDDLLSDGTENLISISFLLLHLREVLRILFPGLQNLRIGRKVEVLLETRDHNETPIDRGGEHVTAEIRHRDAGVSKSLAVNVQDRRDGTYGISFVPDVAGKLALNVCVKGQAIKGSPFPLTVRTIKPHHGTFHCCSFCSSGGNKDATCGCEGRMPGGYKGCGHGHEGHPGRRHWSCCGNVLEHSECVRSNSQYQFTL
ncbi:hypothetical protein NQ315_003421 [Exocentrus adspersus]|uniref:Tripartite motif-containing protein 45 n=1 Tax=Exocentrus adspersus TaxID=1586481 RepID=A0AAV8VNW1_9CUCU|nr:hypothetical protein NQ315_003421 [Exocentrus adspersus]